MRHVIICLLCGIAVITTATSVLAQEAVLYDKAIFPESDPSPEGKECTNNRDCRSSQICFLNRCMTKTQRLTIRSYAKNLIVPGATLTAVGGAAAIGGAIVFIMASSEPVEDISDAISQVTGIVYIGIPLLAPGGVVLITGVALLASGLVKRKKIRRGEFGFNINTKRRRITLEPAIAAGENGGVFGLSGRF
jgi:hypothetical protein